MKKRRNREIRKIEKEAFLLWYRTRKGVANFHKRDKDLVGFPKAEDFEVDFKKDCGGNKEVERLMFHEWKKTFGWMTIPFKRITKKEKRQMDNAFRKEASKRPDSGKRLPAVSINISAKDFSTLASDKKVGG